MLLFNVWIFAGGFSASCFVGLSASGMRLHWLVLLSVLHVVSVFAVYPQWLLLACLCLSLWFVRSGFWLLRSCIVISTRVLPLRSVWRGRRFVILFAEFVIMSSKFVFECVFVSKLVL